MNEKIDYLYKPNIEEFENMFSPKSINDEDENINYNMSYK